jgi:hypothetical protein
LGGSREAHIPILRQYEREITEMLTDSTSGVLDADAEQGAKAYDTFMAAGYLEMSEEEQLKFIAGYQAARKGNGSASDWEDRY